MTARFIWRTAYRHARLMNYGSLHFLFVPFIADAAKAAAEFRRPLHGGHRDFHCPPVPLRLRLLYWRRQRLAAANRQS